MFEIATIIICIITLILLKIIFDISFKRIKNLQYRKFEESELISEKFPKDEEICNNILKKLNAEKVKIKLEPEYSSCLYTVFNNTITIGKFHQNYMKIQTIAHECIHSCQNKRILWSNFIFTNIYMIYFFIILVLTFFNKIQYNNIHILILIFLSIIQYIIRFNLENEAMIKAKYLAKEYIEENEILNKEENDKLMTEYEEINRIAIPFMNYNIISSNIVKIIMYSIVSLV